MFLMGKQTFMIACKPRSFFLGLCLNLIISATKIFIKIFTKCKKNLKIYISSYIFFFGEKNRIWKKKREFFGHISIWILEGGWREGFLY